MAYEAGITESELVEFLNVENQIEGKGIVKDLICYCFEYSVDDITQDYLANGKSTIMDKIQIEKKFGNCQCATKNPKGK